jgi:LysR family glycine cleavage system transcriptional activator
MPMASNDLVPPFAALRAFQAAARAGSFRAAAQSLNITESAVSHQIRRLEDLLHTQLFERHGTRTELTPAGKRYFADIDPALRAIADATRALLGPSGRARVTLTLPPSLAINWIIPNLAAFEADNPAIDLELVTTTRLLDLRHEQVDLAIRHGGGNWPDVDAMFLLAETAMPVARPDLIADGPGDAAAVLSRLRPIVNRAFPDEWQEWARAHGVAPPNLEGALRLETIDQVIAAAERGLGVAIGRSPIVDEHLRTGQLVAPFGEPNEATAGYYLCRTPHPPPTVAVRQVMGWLRDAAGAGRT